MTVSVFQCDIHGCDSALIKVTNEIVQAVICQHLSDCSVTNESGEFMNFITALLYIIVDV